MEEMEFTDLETAETTVLDRTLEIKMQDFRTCGKMVREEKYMKYKNSFYELKVDFSVFAFPNGADKNTEGWLVVVPNVYLKPVFNAVHRPTNRAVSWILSVIDIEGNSRFLQSFESDGGKLGTLEILPNADISYFKYLERSFILTRADEFLPGGVLTLRCDIYLHLSGVSLGYTKRWLISTELSYFEKFFYWSTQRVCFENDPEKRDLRDTSKVFDLTSGIVTRQKIKDYFETFGHYDISQKLLSAFLEPREGIADISKHVWVFEAYPDKFILSFDERKDTVGTRFLKASSLIRECVSIPLKGQQENRVVLQKADSETFRIVLYLLAVGAVRDFEFFQLVNVYRFCHFYEMEELQRRCCEYMAENTKLESDCENELSDFEELERIAELYSDEYLSELLKSRRRECKNLERDLPLFRMEESPCFDCYI